MKARLAAALLATLVSGTALAGETNCYAKENSSGDQLAEGEAKSLMDCSSKMTNTVRANKCPGNKGKVYDYSIHFHGKVGNRQKITCR